MSALQSALAELRSAATTSTLPHLPTPQSAALLAEIDRLTGDLAEARRQVQAACCGPWHERETTEADAAAFPWGRVKAAREVAARWHSHAHWQASQGPHEATVAWAVAQTLGAYATLEAAQVDAQREAESWVRVMHRPMPVFMWEPQGEVDCPDYVLLADGKLTGWMVHQLPVNDAPAVRVLAGETIEGGE